MRGFHRFCLKWGTMAITKILARNARLDAAINYVINGDKTEDHILTAYLNCDPGLAYAGGQRHNGQLC